MLGQDPPPIHSEKSDVPFCLGYILYFLSTIFRQRFCFRLTRLTLSDDGVNNQHGGDFAKYCTDQTNR